MSNDPTLLPGKIPLGNRLRKRRKQMKLTLKEVAEQASLSTSFLSEIERNITSPAIGTLKRITNILQINIAELFSEPDASPEWRKNSAAANPSEEDVTRKQHWRELVYSSTSKIRWFLLVSHTRGKMMEPLVAILEPGAYSGDPGSAHAQGEEFLMVLEGRIKLWLDNKEYELSEGDSFYFDATIVHRYMNMADGPSVMLAIASPPSF
ncbi:MAG: cupin domain-containing protein [Paenibacillaceae bacterium]|nr:cupin domain-containing protein [Paenibacillaceae bacterium]